MPDWLRQLLGVGSIAGSTIGREEPGYVTEARQGLRAPVGARFTNIINDPAITGQFTPLLQRQEGQILDDVQQRVAAGKPASIQGIGGPEVANLRDMAEQQLIPQRQALIGNLGLNLLNTEQAALGKVLESGKPDELSKMLGLLGGSLLSTGGNGGTARGTGNGILDLLGGFGNAQDGGGFLNNLFGGGNNGAALGSVAGTAASLGRLGLSLGNVFGNGGREILETATGYPVGVMDASGNVTDMFGNPMNASQLGGGAGSTRGFFAPQASGSTGWAGLTSGQGLAGAPGFGTAGGLMSGFGSAAGGYAAGSMAAPHLTNFANRDDAWKWLNPSAAGLESLGVSDQGLGAFTGAQAGALAGFAVGGPVGAIIGAIAGGVGGFNKVRAAEHAFKAQRLSADQKSQGTTAGSMASFWTGLLGAAGYEDLEGWGSFVEGQIKNVNAPAGPVSYGGFSGVYDQQDAIVAVGANTLLKRMREINPQIKSLDDIQGFRQGYIDHIMSTTMIEQGGKVVPTQDIDQQSSLLRSAGIDSPSGPGTLNPRGAPDLNVNQYGDITHQFANVDRASPADAQAVVSKLRAAGYNGPLPASLTTPVGPGSFGAGRSLVQTANALLRGLREGLTPEQTIREYSIV